mmetsp:Transcript_27884/g.39231  ORF Transcript_27884/g.39231 Transcript_27884/m.39231 type:complete len:231 (+) Transcript_27884:91-783(+)
MTLTLSKSQQELLSQLSTSLDQGLSSEEASKRRDEDEDGNYNVVDPPLKCPAWACIILPCIKYIPSMKLFREIQPDDAEVLRDGHWIRYDAASLVRGDIVRLEEGDVVPADCTCLCTSGDDDMEMLVDVRHITGETKPRTVAKRTQQQSSDTTTMALKPVQIFYGGHVVQGSGIVVVTSTGSSTLLASLIADRRWPPQGNIMEEYEDGDNHTFQDEEVGVSLIPKQSGSS